MQPETKHNTQDWPIVPGTPWNEGQKRQWLEGVLAHRKKRNYQDILTRLQKLPANIYHLEKYGALPTPQDSYSLMRVTIGDLSNGKPNVLITGGVHGYEPSGVEAAIRFLENEAPRLSDKFNFVVYPCISPWAYEYDQRWNWQAEDVNRNFSTEQGIVQIEECTMFMSSLQNLGRAFHLAIDLHETNDRDIALRQMRASRFGTELDADFRHIPQGFYLTLTRQKMAWQNELQREFGEAILQEVKKVSPIAPDSVILGVENEGGLLLASSKPNLMRGFIANHARLVALTEVYPDHPDMGPEKAVQTQLAAIRGALDYILQI